VASSRVNGVPFDAAAATVCARPVCCFSARRAIVSRRMLFSAMRTTRAARRCAIGAVGLSGEWPLSASGLLIRASVH